MNRAAARVEAVIRRRRRDDRLRLTSVDGLSGHRITTDVTIATADRPAALVVMVMATEHEVDSVTIEERQPSLAYPLVAAVAVLSRTHSVLMHLYDDPVDAVVLPRRCQCLLEPAGLGTGAVPPYVQRGPGRDRCVPRARCGCERHRSGVESTAVLVDHIVGRE